MGNGNDMGDERLKATVNALANGESLHQMCHLCHPSEPLLQQAAIEEIITLSRALLFPGFFGGRDISDTSLEYAIGIQCERLKSVLEVQVHAGLIIGARQKGEQYNTGELAGRASQITADFIDALPGLRDTLRTDVSAIYLGDPAATSSEEVIYCYPALKAITNYRIAHQLFTSGVPIIPRMISESAHSETGIDIHPGATIGGHFAIDHGTGVVIGATAIVGNNVKLYQGVTLGARSFDLDENNNPIKGIPRHPIIGDNVVVYSNASILGRVTIGDNAVIGGNLWVTFDVAPGEKLVQAKADNILRFKS